MAAMSLGFIVMVTPWTIQEVVAACTGSKVNWNSFLLFSSFAAIIYELNRRMRKLGGEKKKNNTFASEALTKCSFKQVPPFLDFIITWTALSNSFWNPFLYWLLNAHFRRLSRELFLRLVSIIRQ